MFLRKERKEKNIYYMQLEEIEQIACEIKRIFQKSIPKDVIILCIGSDLTVGDSLGPLVGTMLKENQVPYHVYGTLEEPIHALNLRSALTEINKQFNEPFILSIDASLGDKSQIGHIFLEKGPLIPGKAFNKGLPAVGDYHIKAIVNDLDPFSPQKFFREIRLYTVMNMAKIIAATITQAATLKVHQQNE